MRYLAAIAIGPVQDFIAAARRCRDLWCGSHLLSELSKAAARELDGPGVQLIFPAPTDRNELEEDSDFTVVNKLLASVDTTDIRGLIRDVEAAVRRRLATAADLREMKLRGLVVKEDLYNDQLENLVEFYAAWVPELEYKESRSRVEELLAARKTLRNFPAYEGGAGEYKSSLDGAREHVIEKRSTRLYESNLKKNEYLDAIGIVKRFGPGNPRFDSTVDIAALPFVEGIREHPKKAGDFRRYLDFIRDRGLMPRTYSLLYEHESRQLFDEDKDKDEAAKAELKEIRKCLGKPNPPYFALLVGDGDRMGEKISNLDEVKAHRKFSQALSEFAGRARKLIDSETFGGCSIYCGGDDVLGLLPLHTALDCARYVNGLFRACMSRYKVTFSAGLVVAHGLEPLTEVREWGRSAESAAKKSSPEKDALCISVHPRSGAPIEVSGKWEELCHLLSEIARLYDEIPRRLAYEMRELLDRLKGWDEIESTLGDLVVAMANKKDCSGEALELIRSEAKDRDRLERFYRLLLVAKWFARAEREAKGDRPDNRN